MIDLKHIIRLIARAIFQLHEQGLLTRCCVCGHRHLPGGSGVVDEIGEMIIVAVCSDCPTRGSIFEDARATERWLKDLTPPADYIRVLEDREAFVSWLEGLAGKSLAQVMDN